MKTKIYAIVSAILML